MLKGNTVEERVWNYLYSKIKNKYGVAGLMGNIYAESGMIFNRLEILCRNRIKEYYGINYSDSEYTKAVDNGTISRERFLHPLPNRQYGYGLIQLTSPGRKAGLYDLCKSRKVSIADEQAQLDYLIIELTNSYKAVLSTLESAKSVKEASDVVLKKFECPADTGTSMQNLRASYGQKYYNLYANAATNVVKDDVNMANNQAKLVMDKAISYVGTKESPANSNNVIFNTHYYGGAVSGSAYPWCCAFVWDIFRMAGLSNLFYDGKKTAYCPTVLNWARQNGLVVSKTSAQYGDIVLFDWGGDGVSDHIGLVEYYDAAKGEFHTVEGNTCIGNDSNGGEVMRRNRYASQIIAIVRPRYTGASVSPVVATSPSNLLSKGSQGDKVKELQRNLNTILGLSLKVDGDFGNNTYNAVIQFQKKYNLEVDGVVGDETTKKISSVLASMKNTTTTTTVKYDSKKLQIAQYLEKKVSKNSWKTTDCLNLRYSADTSSNSNIICEMPNGSEVLWYGYYNKVGNVKWFYVSYKGMTGYCSSEFLK